jgi:hypothetical protein
MGVKIGILFPSVQIFCIIKSLLKLECSLLHGACKFASKSTYNVGIILRQKFPTAGDRMTGILPPFTSLCKSLLVAFAIVE